jgi:hypothetical protein
MTTLARFSIGRILLHLLAMSGDRCVRFHVAGIIREIAPLAAAPALLARMRARVIDGFVRYLTAPSRRYTPDMVADPRSLARILDRGDVLAQRDTAISPSDRGHCHKHLRRLVL